MTLAVASACTRWHQGAWDFGQINIYITGIAGDDPVLCLFQCFKFAIVDVRTHELQTKFECEIRTLWSQQDLNLELTIFTYESWSALVFKRRTLTASAEVAQVEVYGNHVMNLVSHDSNDRLYLKTSTFCTDSRVPAQMFIMFSDFLLLYIRLTLPSASLQLYHSSCSFHKRFRLPDATQEDCRQWVLTYFCQYISGLFLSEIVGQHCSSFQAYARLNVRHVWKYAIAKFSELSCLVTCMTISLEGYMS